ncbi:hypothetical protein ACLOJK_007568 [Asimina triloba]
MLSQGEKDGVDVVVAPSVGEEGFDSGWAAVGSGGGAGSGGRGDELLQASDLMKEAADELCWIDLCWICCWWKTKMGLICCSAEDADGGLLPSSLPMPVLIGHEEDGSDGGAVRASLLAGWKGRVIGAAGWRRWRMEALSLHLLRIWNLVVVAVLSNYSDRPTGRLVGARRRQPWPPALVRVMERHNRCSSGARSMVYLQCVICNFRP